MLNNAAEACISSRAILDKCEGGFIEDVLFRAVQENTWLRLKLYQVPEIDEVVIHLERVRNLRVDTLTELDGAFIDRVEATFLPKLDDPWPAEAEGRVVRFEGLPDLIWLRVIGPTSVDVVCETMSVTSNAPEAGRPE